MARTAAQTAKSKPRATKKAIGRASPSPVARKTRAVRQITAYTAIQSATEDPIESSESEEAQEVQPKGKKRGANGGGKGRGTKRAAMQQDSDSTELEESLGLEDDQVQAHLNAMLKAAANKQAQAIKKAQDKSVNELEQLYAKKRAEMAKGADNQFEANTKAIDTLMKSLSDAGSKINEKSAFADGSNSLEDAIGAMGKDLARLVNEALSKHQKAIADAALPLKTRRDKLVAAKKQIMAEADMQEAAGRKKANRALSSHRFVDQIKGFMVEISS